MPSKSAAPFVDPALRLRRISTHQRPEHSFLQSNDDCYFLWEYSGGLARRGGRINELILDLKLPPEAESKQLAVSRCALALGPSLAWAGFREATVVPMPSSKRRGSPLYDPRLLRMLEQVRPPLGDIRELIVAKKTAASGAKGMTIAERMRLWELTEEDNREPETIILFDDLIASGNHFKAAQAILHRRYPGAAVIGVFLARRSLAHSGSEPAGPPPPQREKVVVFTSGKCLDEVADAAIEALALGNSPPRLMVKEGRLVRVRAPGTSALGRGHMVVEPLSGAALLGELARGVCFRANTPWGERNVDPPRQGSEIHLGRA